MAEIDYHSFHSDLVDKFEAAEESGDSARRKAERDIDYYDGKQWTDREVKELKRRGQPAITQNLIKQKIDFLQGLERQQRTVPNALPRTPRHEDDANSATDALRFVIDDNRYNKTRSKCWEDILKAGWGGVEVVASQRAQPRANLEASTAMTPPVQYDVIITRTAWDRMFWDPYAAEEDFSDAGYLGLVIWMDREEAVRRYGKEAAQVYDETISAHSIGNTFDDKPQKAWVSTGRRQRIRVVQMYYIGTDGEWDFCEFTKGGILQAGPSPWEDEDGKREHPYAWTSAYIDRDNNRYGEVRNLIDPQDEINKRRSKALHHFTSRQTFGNQQALGNMSAREMRTQLSRPDGHVSLTGTAKFGEDFGVIPTNDQAAGHFELLQQSMQTFEIMGPNAALLGKKEGNESGRAIMAQQQGGQIQVGPIVDALREMDIETYRKIWRRIRQFWTAETWIRVTDDDKTLKWVQLNKPKMQPVMMPAFGPDGMAQQQPVMDPATGQPAMQPVIDPATGQPVLENSVSELDVDIEIDDAPDMGSLQQEQFAGLVDLAKVGVAFPPKVYLEASNLRNKGKLIRMMEEQGQPPPEQQAAMKLQLEQAQAEVADTQAGAVLKQAQARKAMMESGGQGEAGPSEIDIATALAEIRNKNAGTDKLVAETRQTAVETALMPHEMAQQEQERQESRQERMMFKRADMQQARQPA